MSFDLPILEAAHKHSIFNEKEVLQSNLCGCFYCMKTFTPSEIKEWIEEDNGTNTPRCPYCEIDSVIGDRSGYPISDENFLKAMHKHWFT
jgi:hypothetical protein